MTAPPPAPDDLDPDDLDPDDDAVLAVLDETATAAQRRQVARDPGLRSRLAAQQAAVAALRTPVPPLADDVADRIRARALTPEEEGDEGRDEEDDEGQDGGHPAVVPLAPRRPTRRWPGWPAVAAVVILLLGVGAALIVNDRTGSDSAHRLPLADASSQAAEEVARDLGDEAAGGGAPAATANQAEGGGSAAMTDASGAEADELVHYPDQEALEQELRAVDPLTLQPPGAGDGRDPAAERAVQQAAFCDPGLREVDPDLSPVRAARLVVVDGQEVLVMSHPVQASGQTPAGTRLTALDARSCTPLFAVQR